MVLHEAQTKLRQLLEQYWEGASVAWGDTNMVRPTLPFVTLKVQSITRPAHPCSEYLDGQFVDRYHITARIDVNLFTKGQHITGTDGYHNTAVSDMSRFVSFLNSEYAASWCDENGIAVHAEGQCLDATAILNTNAREYRAFQQLTMSFVETATGYAGVSTERGFAKSASGGGSNELAALDAGHFTDIELTQEDSYE